MKKKHKRAEDGEPMKNKHYEGELQSEIWSLPAWGKHEGLRVIIVFEGRDAAGKGKNVPSEKVKLPERSRKHADDDQKTMKRRKFVREVY